MHTSFTGSARKSRQVNLSGRNVANPWAAVPAANNTAQATGTQSTLAQAQADRLRRQQERDRQNAARKIQKTWRGHVVRHSQREEWRRRWDMIEVQRLGVPETSDHQDILDLAESYSDFELAFSQIQSLTRFFHVNNEQDILRLRLLGLSLQKKLSGIHNQRLGNAFEQSIAKLVTFMINAIEVKARSGPGAINYEQDMIQMLQLVAFLNKQVSDLAAHESQRQFHALGTVLRASRGQEKLRLTLSDFTITLLLAPSDTLSSYKAFAMEMLQNVEVVALKALLNFFSHPSHQKLLSQAISEIVAADADTSGNVEQYLCMLSYLVYIGKGTELDSTSFREWLQAVSVLLGRCANDLSERFQEKDQSVTASDSAAASSFHPFIWEQISILVQQQNVEHVVQKLQTTGDAGQASVSDIAKPLANYAIALLRAFPDRALNIRMWLYRSSPPSGFASLSTIQYLWQAAQSTGVFQKITKDHRSVLSVLTEAAPEHNQIGRAKTSSAEIAVWQEEWRLVLLFLELYTFILKIMDDEEFFALGEHRAFTAVLQGSQFSQGALPLEDIARMTTFLKNLAFPLYWNASDLAETNEIEEMGGISALFGTASTERPKQQEKKPPKTLAGNGVSQAYLKDRVTALLRMLHERDSRRKFLPEDYWLMTNHVDMQGFIPAVVAEEERRHEFGEDTDEDQDVEEDLEATEDSMTLQTFSSMFGIRPPHTPRSRTSRFNDKLARRRDRERKRRQAESLVPRIEILRNLPFFIPFETRVQIFREFVYRDQFRRRNGYVDADDWRVSIANGMLGRGPDRQGRGMDSLGRHHADIRRGSVFSDAFDNFYEIGEGLKEPIQISFIDQFGAVEAGIDGGGVTKEFLMSVTSEAFDPQSDMPMFLENEQRLLFPNPKNMEWTHEVWRRQGMSGEIVKLEIREMLRRYEFLGRIIGKCLYEGILVDLSFAGFFLLKWALTGGTTSATNETAYRASINDLRDYDEELYQGLLKLKNYRGDVEGDFGLDFTASDEVEVNPGKRHTWTQDLVPDGANKPVTNANRLLYIDKITRYRLQQQPLQVTNAFLRGLGQIIQPMWLAMFNQRELQKLVGGDNAELDINDLRRNTQYGGLYVIGDDGLEHPTIALFWKVLREMDDADRRKVLKFVTSTPRAPLLGFSHLNPRFSIRDSSEDQSRLPSTSTCVNLLKLPRYGDERTMKEKLLYAVNSGAGFDLS